MRFSLPDPREGSTRLSLVHHAGRIHEQPRRIGAGSAAILFLLAFIASVLLFSRANDFPYYYHPDEPGKVKQLQSGKRNFHHPQLLLNTATVGKVLTGSPDDPQQLVMIGRWCSALFAAAAVGLVAVFAARHAGLSAGVGTAGILSVNALLAEGAHFFKEDTALAFGFAAFCVAISYFADRASLMRLLFLALATVAALSAKWIGVLVLPFGLLAVQTVERRAGGAPSWPLWLSPVAVYVAVVVGGFIAVNFQVLVDLRQAFGGLGLEVNKLLDNPLGVQHRIPNLYGWRTMLHFTPWLVLGFAAIAVTSPVLLRRRPRLAEAIILMLFAVYGVSLMFTGKVAERYSMPLVVLLAPLAMMGASWTVQRLTDWSSSPIRNGVVGLLTLLVAAAAVLAEIPLYRSLQVDLETDTRFDLAQFVRTELPPAAIIVQDKKVKLPDPDRPDENVYNVVLPQRIITARGSGLAADVGDIDSLRAQGVTHVAIAEADWSPYFASGKFVEGLSDPESVRRRDFYRFLFDETRRVWHAPSGEAWYVRQGISLYDIQPTGQ